MTETEKKGTKTTERLPCEYCGDSFRGKKGLRIHQAQAHDEETSTTVRCTWCGDELTVREWKAEGRHYCSTDCSKAWNRFLRKGENHPNYKGGGSNRPDHYRLIAMAVRSRDEYTCQRCGSQKTADNRRLHVHHLTPEDETSDPHRFENLVTVCDRCHQPLEKLDVDQQLEECGIESRDELALSEDDRAWYDAALENVYEVNEDPEPWPGMFEEAQKVLEERDSDE